MQSNPQNTDTAALPAGAIAAALDWWRDAGVDCHFADDATSWLAQPQSEEPAVVERPAKAAPPVARKAEALPEIGGPRSGWPATLDAFESWWMAEPSLDGGQTAGRLAPRGNGQSGLMVLVEQPEADDEGQLLSGPQGKLLQGILRAIGVEDGAAYIASVLPRHMPMPDWPLLQQSGLGALTAHHIELAAPQRIIVFGSNVSSLLGHDPANSDGFVTLPGAQGRRISALVAPGLSALAMRTRGKARLWQALLDWTSAD